MNFVAQTQAAYDRLSIPESSVTLGGPGPVPCTAGTTCLFANEGGGIDYNQVDDLMVSSFWLYDQESDGSVAGVGTAAVDTYMIAIVSEEVCAALNEGLGIAGIPVETTTWNPFGSIEIDSSAGNFSGSFDIISGGGGTYDFYHVLKAY